MNSIVNLFNKQLPMQARLKPGLPWIFAALSVVMMVLGLTLGFIYMVQTPSTEPLLSHQGLLQISTIFYAAVGGLILSRQPRNIIGWLFIASSFFAGLNSLSVGYEYFARLEMVDWLPSTAWINWISRWSWLPTSVLPTFFVFLYFPHGRLPGRRWTFIAWCLILGLVIPVVSIALHPGTIEDWDLEGPNQFGIPGTGEFFEMTLNLGMIPLFIGSVGSLLALGLRFRKSKQDEREQMKWLVYAVIIYVAGSILAGVIPGLLGVPEEQASEILISITGVGILAIVGAVGTAILRYRLYDIDLVINRTLVYSALTTAVLGIYLLIAGGLGLILQSPDNLASSLISVGIIAIIVQPTRDRLQRAVNHLMYGNRDDPYAALTQLGQRLENTLAPDAVLAIIVETVAQTLKLPYTAVSMTMQNDDSIQKPQIVASYGAASKETLNLPLTYQTEQVGSLIVGARSGENFSNADRQLLSDLARQAGVAVHAVRLNTELQQSRERLVTTREEERRRLRRDLHDGLGSQLAAMHLRLDTLRKLIPDDAEPAKSLAVELRDEIHDAVADIRRLVYELRPPALDELGLTGALRSLAARMDSKEDLQVSIIAPEQLPILPAAVEVAAYRIAQEALTNVIRHARATKCEIEFQVNGGLKLTVSDDGLGLPDQPHASVGLHSMRERAEELGGKFTVQNANSGGVKIVVHLPLTK